VIESPEQPFGCGRDPLGHLRHTAAVGRSHDCDVRLGAVPATELSPAESRTRAQPTRSRTNTAPRIARAAQMVIITAAPTRLVGRSAQAAASARQSASTSEGMQ
jgi:hypothetical protein